MRALIVILLLLLSATGTHAEPAPTPQPSASPSPPPAAKPAAKKPPAGASPGTPSPWGIPPSLRPRNAKGVLWYFQTQNTQSGVSLDPRVEARHVAVSQLIPLRSDREALGSRFVTPVGGDPTDGITVNSFALDRGDAATLNHTYGVAFPLDEADTLSVDGVLYARAGNPALARNYGATLPFGAFVDRSPSGVFNMPSLEPLFGRITYVHEGPRHKIRAVAGDYMPVIWGPVEGPTQRNYIDLSHLTFRSFQANLSVLAFGTIYPPDRQFGPPRAPMRGADFWMKSGDFEVEVLSSRQETHPTDPFQGWRYRQAVGGRVGYTHPRFGLGLSAFHMYGDNVAVPGDPTSTTTPAGGEGLWMVDGSVRLVGDLNAYGAYGATNFHARGTTFGARNDALIGGLYSRGWPSKDAELRLQYQSVGPNYEGLSLRNQVAYPANYRIWAGEARYPFTGGQVFASVRQSEQLHPDVVSGTTFAVNDPAFPSNAANRGKGNVLDWLATAEYKIPDMPLKLYLSWEEVAFNRGVTPGLANSATHRAVGQQSAMLRIRATDDVAVHVGVGRFQCGGTIGSFTRTVQFRETQVVPRLGLTWTPTPDLSAYVMLQQYRYTDGLAVSQGLNNYNASQFILELQSRVGGGF